MEGEPEQGEVTIVGRGLAGMAASLHLAMAGFRVVCVGPDRAGSAPVGESLDWSAPALLEELGLPMERLIGENLATYKRHVTAKLMNGSARHYVPREWLAEPPYNIELRTLHLDRFRFDEAMRELVRNQQIEIVAERVVDVETVGRRVGAVRTESGRRISSSWFIDASGSNARLFPRALQLHAINYGPKKVAMWTHFAVPDAGQGTTLYFDGQPSYVEWIWEIPVHPDMISVGCVAGGEAIKQHRQRGLTMEQIYRERLARIPRFATLLEPRESFAPHITSFQCRVHRGIVGPNWLVAGEAASMVDPMTSNGVTAALRSAAEAAALVIQSRERRSLPRIAAAMYSRRIVDLGRFFNCGIERAIYDRPVRDRIGLLTAGRVYTVPAWVMNAVYARLRPSGVISTLLFGSVLGLFRLAAVVLQMFCRKTQSSGQRAR